MGTWGLGFFGPLTVSAPEDRVDVEREGTRHKSQTASVCPSSVWRRLDGSCGAYASEEGFGRRQARIVESKEAEKIVESGEEMTRDVIGPEWVRYVIIGSNSVEFGLEFVS